MTTATRNRPFLVTLLVVLVVLGAIGWVLTGILTITLSGDVAPAGITVLGIIFVLLGLAYLAVAKGLLDGNPRARMIVLVVAALQILFAIIGLFASSEDLQNGRSSGGGSGVLAVIIIIVLFLPKVREFFGRRTV